MSLKLDKYQLQFILNEIQEDNFEYGLILKLIYTYGRNINEVLQLKVADINFEDGYITFNLNQQDSKGDFPITNNVGDDLFKYFKKFNPEDYLFVNTAEEINLIKNRLNNYLGRISISLTKQYFNSPIKLSSKDFRILRGKHLFLDGVGIEEIHNLYCFAYMKDTKNTIGYKELMKLFLDKAFPFNYESIFAKFSDFDKVDDDSIDINPEFYTVTDGEFTIMISTDFDDKGDNLYYTDGTDVYDSISPLFINGLDIQDRSKQEEYVLFLSEVIKIADDLLENIKSIGAGNSFEINNLKISKK